MTAKQVQRLQDTLCEIGLMGAYQLPTFVTKDGLFRTSDKLPQAIRAITANSAMSYLRQDQIAELVSSLITMEQATPHRRSRNALEISEGACDQLRVSIKMACSEGHEQAQRLIARIWEQIARTEQFAEARMRLCLGKAVPPPTANRPEWLESAIHELQSNDEGLAASHPLAIESADLLLRAFLVKQSAAVIPEVERAPLGAVSVIWDNRTRRILWLISAPRIPWPGIEVRATKMDFANDQAHVEVRAFFSADDALRYLDENI